MKAIVLGLAFAALTAGAALAADATVTEIKPSATAPAAPTVRVGALIKDDKGQSLGRVSRITTASGNQPAKVEIRIGDEIHSVVQSQLTAKDNYFVYAAPKDVKVVQPFSITQ